MNYRKTGAANRFGEYTSKPSWAIVWQGTALKWFTSASAAELNCVAFRQNGWSGAYVEFCFNQK